MKPNDIFNIETLMTESAQTVNEVNPHNYDSDEDYYNAVNAPAKPKYRSQQSPGVDPDDEAYFREIWRKKREAAAKAQQDGEQGVAEGTPTMWEVCFDYGPHMSDTVKVKAGSEDEAIAKVEKAAEKRGRSIDINWAKPAEQGVAEAGLGYPGGRSFGGGQQYRYGSTDMSSKLKPASRPGPEDKLDIASQKIAKDIAKAKKKGVAEGYLPDESEMKTVYRAKAPDGNQWEVKEYQGDYLTFVNGEHNNTYHATHGMPYGAKDRAIEVVRRMAKQGVAEETTNNPEYSDEVGYVKDNLHTIVRICKMLNNTMVKDENLPDWVQEKVAQAKGMLVASADYLKSQHEQGRVYTNNDTEMSEGPDYAAMYESQLNEFSSAGGTGGIATSMSVGSPKAGTLFGGSYSQKNSPFKKNKPKKAGMIKR